MAENSKIENLLKAYAVQRRQEAGDFELDPITRRILKRAAAKTYPEQTPRFSIGRLWKAFWPGLALAGGIGVIIFAAVIRHDVPAIMRTVKAPAQNFESLADSAKQTATQSKTEDASTLAAAPVAPVPAPSAASRLATESEKARGVAVGGLASPSPQRESIADDLRTAKRPQVLARQSSAANRTEPLAKQSWTFQGTASSQVLTSFTIAKEGQTVRVTDSDGSVYVGEFLASDDKKLKESIQTNQPLQFRVTGVSKRLQKTVTFTATILEPLNSGRADRDSAAPMGGLGGGGSAARSRAPESKSTYSDRAPVRLNGRVQVGTNTFTLDAAGMKK